MKKSTKLTEKTTRIPDTRQMHWAEAISQYLQQVNQLNTESARSHRFAMLLQQLLGLEPNFIEAYSTGIEQYLKVRQKDRILKGEADNLFGNIIIEFEVNIPKKRLEAEDQLRRYVAILWSQEKHDARSPYICIATDGVRFLTYSPTVANPTAKYFSPENVQLRVLEESDWSKLEPNEIFYWLDRYFLRKEILHPTSEYIVRDFGTKSHAFQTTTTALLILWQGIKTHGSFAVVYDSWEKYLRVVYGSEIAGDELFIRHTYLATLAKLMSWSRISESTRLPDDAQIVEMLEGRLFKAQGIENFIEEDFFSWLSRAEAVKVGVNVARWLFSLLQNYNLRELSEDVLKSLYQELVDPETRHDLGEFYTPDWLAHRMVNKLLDTNPSGSLLDPTCGSGTFLYLAIREKRKRLGDSLDTLRHILDSVYGVDIHPLAVIVAKTNYILALGDSLKKRKGSITIPIYLADSLHIPERWMKTEPADYEVTLNDRSVYIHEALLQDLTLYDQSIELTKDFARQNKSKSITLELFRNFLMAQHFPKTNNVHLVQALFSIAETLKYFIDIDRDTIWAFVLKNIYKPLFFKHQFDFIIGNPPWIAFRFMEPSYQAFLKRQITGEYKLLAGRGELITHLEVGTLFFVRAADLYLKSGGTIAFVLPKSVFSADQHDGLRQRTFIFSENTMQNLFWHEIWDCEHVSPLFNISSCVLIADKKETAPIRYPVIGQILSGKLDRKNESLVKAKKNLTIENVEFSVHIHGKRSFWTTDKSSDTSVTSYYKKRFAQGATIVPRSFWFVQVKPSPLGFNPDLPPLETDDRAMKEAKETYKSVFSQGAVESRFLYITLLSADLFPFGHFGYRLVVLPIEPAGEHYRILDANKARQRGFLHLARWLEIAEEEWNKRRGEKAKLMSIYERLDRVHGLTNQNPQAKYRVIYNTSGTILTAAIVENAPMEIEINRQNITVNGFLADTKTYFYETTNRHEASYLAAVLNAPVVDKLIKPMQSRGLWGPRDIHKKVLDLPIPKFDTKNPAYLRLAELGNECSIKVEHWLARGDAGTTKSIGRLRGMVRVMLLDELTEIDNLVKGILEKQGFHFS